MAPKNKDSVLNRGAACLECRKRKLKCDAIKPYCGACVKSGRQDRCIYEAIRNKNLADQLEERVNQLERMVERMEREGSAVTTGLTPAPTHSLGTEFGATPGTSYAPASGSSMAASGIPVPNGNYGTFSPLDHQSNSRLHYLDALLTLPWDDAAESWSRLPDESHNFLVDIFITYLPKSTIQLHTERFLSSLALPDDNPMSIHPAMLASVYLLACYHWSDSLMSYEATFLAQARTLMQDSLAKKDRLFTGFIQPGILVTEYLLNRGRLREAYHQIIQTTRFAIGCNLHKITSAVWRPNMSTGPSGLLPSPFDSIELGERILAFWAAFMLDQKCCIMGLPSSFAKVDDLDTRNRIDTVWPNNIAEYEASHINHSDAMTLRFLCTDGPPISLQEGDNGFKIRLQSFALYKFAGDSEMAPDDVDLAITQFLRRLPALDPNDQGSMSTLTVAHAVAHAATICLCARSSPTQTMDSRALEASLSCARMINMLNMTEYDMWCLDIVLSYIWVDCAKILARYIREKEQSGALAEGTRLRPALTAILGGLARIGQVYPAINMSSHTLVVNRTPYSPTGRHPYNGFRNTQSTHYPRAFCHYTPVASAYTSSAQMVVTLDGSPSLRPSVKSRKRVTPHQLKHLERVFASETHPSRGSREELARELGMELKSVTIWFQNKRQSIKRNILSNGAPSRTSTSDDSSTSDERSSPPLCWSSSDSQATDSKPATPRDENNLKFDEDDVHYKENLAAQALCDLLFSAPRCTTPSA
ncbi:fungal Zn(2)-cys(6) binuclear cluster domain protein [Rhizoctonia solani AG-3 Rhs1AP]|uniref:Fungal Zn(2)-cys(6) binuclear cluster domain protein n=1 Tax=Rhizoctonia solani AG-3 Rhs1AP TaxID=1086054 RepID=X8JQI4_9AGAM|nr:fungal Zn(2)-cys(6) binuclear cluster domain protein [Rhizoctonia solani AG-3 Rhs1AP]